MNYLLFSLKNILLGLKFSLSYFSKLPIRITNSENINNQTTLSSFLYFLPFIGIIISSITVILYQFFYPSIYFAIVFSIFYMFLYGFLHTEAICDVVDALYAKHHGKDPYKIIKTPDIGALGMLYTVCFVVLKIATLSVLLINKLYFEFIAVATISRSFIIYSIYNYKFSSQFVNSLQNALQQNGKIYLIFTFFIYFLFTYYLIAIHAFVLFFITLLLTITITKKLKKDLGFLNGDVLGFNIELTELIMMVYFVLLVGGF